MKATMIKHIRNSVTEEFGMLRLATKATDYGETLDNLMRFIDSECDCGLTFRKMPPVLHPVTMNKTPVSQGWVVSYKGCDLWLAHHSIHGLKKVTQCGEDDNLYYASVDGLKFVSVVSRIFSWCKIVDGRI